MFDLDKYHATKRSPRQTRGKETIRQILLASARLFAEHGVATVTTNDIASEAGIPVGSVYSYFDDKNAIIRSLLELYTSDIIAVFDDLADNPLLPYMSRFEVATIVFNAWAYFLELNHPLSYILFARSEPSLRSDVATQRTRLQTSFCRLLHTKSPHRVHDNSPGSGCHLILQVGLDISENAELTYGNDSSARQKYLDMSIPPYCAMVELIH